MHLYNNIRSSLIQCSIQILHSVQHMLLSYICITSSLTDDDLIMYSFPLDQFYCAVPNYISKPACSVSERKEKLPHIHLPHPHPVCALLCNMVLPMNFIPISPSNYNNLPTPNCSIMQRLPYRYIISQVVLRSDVFVYPLSTKCHVHV